MAKGDYEAASRQQRRLAQQHFNNQKIDTDIQTLSFDQFKAIETGLLVNFSDIYDNDAIK